MWLSEPNEYASQHRMTIKEASRFRCTAEHLVARKDGGGDRGANIVAACFFCNRRRHARAKSLSPERYGALVSQRVLAGRWHGVRMLSK